MRRIRDRGEDLFPPDSSLVVNPRDRGLVAVAHQHVESPVLVEVGKLNMSQERVIPRVGAGRIAQHEAFESEGGFSRVRIGGQRRLSFRTECEIEMEDIRPFVSRGLRSAPQAHDLDHAVDDFRPALSGKI